MLLHIVLNSCKISFTYNKFYLTGLGGPAQPSVSTKEPSPALAMYLPQTIPVCPIETSGCTMDYGSCTRLSVSPSHCIHIVPRARVRPVRYNVLVCFRASTYVLENPHVLTCGYACYYATQTHVLKNSCQKAECTCLITPMLNHKVPTHCPYKGQGFACN